MLFNKAKSITLKNFKSFKLYEDFMKNSSQEEFSKSQIPFFHAVKAFPRILCYLGSMIEDSETRLHIAENIWEEHGSGIKSNFHINTFHNYLTAIAGNDYVLSNNPWIDEWINNWFNEKDPLSLSCKLAAIEYLYAPISESLSSHINNLKLNNEQYHYSKHAELDWEHGKELFEVAIKYDHSKNKEIAFELFDKAQKEFIDVFNGMILITKKEVLNISKENIAFYYIREDVELSLKHLMRNNKNSDKNIITICSGGESIINYLSLKNKIEIVTLDMNENQYCLLLEKINKINNGIEINEQNKGKFERIFENLRKRFSNYEKKEFLKNNFINKNKLEFAVKDIFTKENLSIIFTEDAVKYTEKDFASHFFNVLSSDFNQVSFGNENIRNIFTGSNFNYPNMEKLNLNNKSISHISSYINKGEKIENICFKNGKKADLIDLSNIGDWIDINSLRDIITSAKKILSKDGILVLRKLIGDYSLIDEVRNAGFIVEIENDTSNFYEETIIGKIYE